MSDDQRSQPKAPHTDALDMLELAEAPMPWPQRPHGASLFLSAFDSASEEDRPTLFAEAEKEVSPDLYEWDKVLRVLRKYHSDFPIPKRWDDWDLGKEMDKWPATNAAEARWPDE